MPEDALPLVRERSTTVGNAPGVDDAEIAALLKKRPDRVGAVEELDRGVEGTKQQIVELFEAASEEQWRMTQDILRIENEGNLAPLLNLRAMSDLQYARVDLRDVQSQVDEILYHFTTATQGYVAELDQHVEYMKSKMVAYKESLESQRGSMDGMKRRYEACLERMRKNDIQMDFLRGQVVRREAMLHEQRGSYLKELNMYKELIFAKRHQGEDFRQEHAVVDVLGAGQNEAAEPLMAQLEKALKESKQAKEEGRGAGAGAGGARGRQEAQWQQTLDAMKRHHGNELRQASEEYERILAEKDAVIARCEEDARTREEQFRSELEEYAAMQTEGAEEVRRQLEEDLDQLKSDFAVERTALIAAHDDALASANLAHEEAINAARAAAEDDAARLRAEAESLAAELAKKVQMVDTLDADVARLQRERDETLESAQDESAGRAARDAELQRQIKFLEAKVDELTGAAGSAGGQMDKRNAVSRHAFEDLAGCYLRLESKWGVAERTLAQLRDAGVVGKDGRVDFDLLEALENGGGGGGGGGGGIDGSTGSKSRRRGHGDAASELDLDLPGGVHGSSGSTSSKKGKKGRPTSAKPKRPGSRAGSRAGSVAGSPGGAGGGSVAGSSAVGGGEPGGASESGRRSRPTSALSHRSDAHKSAGGHADAASDAGGMLGVTAGSDSASVSSSSSRPASRGAAGAGDASVHGSGRRSAALSQASGAGAADDHLSDGRRSVLHGGQSARAGTPVQSADASAQTPSRWIESLAAELAKERGLFAAGDADAGAGGDDSAGELSDPDENIPLTQRSLRGVVGGGRSAGGDGYGDDDDDDSDAGGARSRSLAPRSRGGISAPAAGGEGADGEGGVALMDDLTRAVQETNELRSRRATVNWELLFKGVVTLAIQRERQRALESGAPAYAQLENDREVEERISNLQVFDRMEARANYRLRRARNRLQMIEEERRINMEKVMSAARLLVDPSDTRRDTFGGYEGAAPGGGAGYGGRGGGTFTTLRVPRGGAVALGGSTAPASFRQRPHSAAPVVSAAGRGAAGGGLIPRAPSPHHPPKRTGGVTQARITAGGVSITQHQQQQLHDQAYSSENAHGGYADYRGGARPPSRARPSTAPDQGGGSGRVPPIDMGGDGGALGRSLRFDGGEDADLMRIQSMTHRDGAYSPPRSVARRVKTPLTERLRRSQSPERGGAHQQFLPRADVKVNFTNLSQSERRNMVLEMIYRDSKLSQLRKQTRGDGRPGTGVRASSRTGEKSLGGKGTPVLITRLGGSGSSGTKGRPRTSRR